MRKTLRQLTQEAEHVLLQGRHKTGVEKEAVTVSSRLVSAIGRDDQERQGTILQLVTHLSDGFTVATTTVIHTLT